MTNHGVDRKAGETKAETTPETMKRLLPREPCLTRGELLSIVLERDVEAPDDENAWIVVLACPGDVPKHLGSGYLHAHGCACVTEDRLCDVGWLEEFVSCAGIYPLLEGNLALFIAKGEAFHRLKLKGYMVSERFETMEGTDFDERFEAIHAEALR